MTECIIDVIKLSFLLHLLKVSLNIKCIFLFEKLLNTLVVFLKNDNSCNLKNVPFIQLLLLNLMCLFLSTLAAAVALSRDWESTKLIKEGV